MCWGYPFILKNPKKNKFLKLALVSEAVISRAEVPTHQPGEGGSLGRVPVVDGRPLELADHHTTYVLESGD